MNIDLIYDLQYGSTGKGLIAGWMATHVQYDAAITCNMPNAGHTFIDADGNKMVHKVLPNGIVSHRCTRVFIGPGAVIDIDRMNMEIRQAQEFGYDQFQVLIHPNVVRLKPEYAEKEKESFNKIASTMQGSAAAVIAKMVRSGHPLMKHDDGMGQEMHPCARVLNHDEWIQEMNRCEFMIAEGSQGFSLGLNQRFWPYCTSRDCGPYRMLSDMALPFASPDSTIRTVGTMRTFPIRVGNTPGGFSGPVYDDQAELSWEDIGKEPELTTVTGRERRIFTFSKQQTYEALWHCRPSIIFLNFCNYMQEDEVQELINDIKVEERRISRDFSADWITGWGPTVNDVAIGTRPPEGWSRF